MVETFSYIHFGEGDTVKVSAAWRNLGDGLPYCVVSIETGAVDGVSLFLYPKQFEQFRRQVAEALNLAVPEDASELVYTQTPR